MRVVFADTGYWIATLDPGDGLHEKAQVVTEQMRPIQILTTDMVLVELLTSMSRRGEYNRRLAAETVRALMTSPDVEVVEQTRAQFEAAVARYAFRLDQQWSVTDCASFLLMEERYVKEALAYDRHFEQAGFVALLR